MVWRHQPSFHKATIAHHLHAPCGTIAPGALPIATKRPSHPRMTFVSARCSGNSAQLRATALARSPREVCAADGAPLRRDRAPLPLHGRGPIVARGRDAAWRAAGPPRGRRRGAEPGADGAGTVDARAAAVAGRLGARVGQASWATRGRNSIKFEPPVGESRNEAHILAQCVLASAHAWRSSIGVVVQALGQRVWGSSL